MELKIGPSQSLVEDIQSKHPPALHLISQLYGEKPSAKEVHLVCTQSALKQIETHSRSNLNSELGGFLLGIAYQHEGHFWVEVSAAIPAVSDEHGPVHFTFTADAWATAHQVREADYAHLKIVGWFHTHPNLGVFYSEDDVVVHSTAFSLPWHLGLVFDPIRDEVALFGWEVVADREKGELLPIPGFFEIGDINTKPALDWKLVYHDSLNGMRLGALKSRRFEELLPDWDRGDKLGPYLFLTMLLTTIFVVVFMLNWHAQQREIDQLSTIVAATAQEKQPIWQADGLIDCPTPNLFILSPEPGTTIIQGDPFSIIGVADLPESTLYEIQLRGISPNTSLSDLDISNIFWPPAAVVTGSQSGVLATIDSNQLVPGRNLLRLTTNQEAEPDCVTLIDVVGE